MSIKTGLAWASIFLGCIAAALWFGSTVVKVSARSVEEKIMAQKEWDGWFPGQIQDDKGNDVFATLERQGLWNRWAAGATSLAMFFQVLSNAWPES